jgi:hypothetical protein
MTKLAKALLETYGVELDPTDRVVLEQNYSEPTIVDVVVTDTLTGHQAVFECFDTATGCFPY